MNLDALSSVTLKIAKHPSLANKGLPGIVVNITLCEAMICKI